MTLKRRRKKQRSSSAVRHKPHRAKRTARRARKRPMTKLQRSIDRSLLGKMTDRALSRKYHCSDMTIGKMRRDAGIPVFKRSQIMQKIKNHPARKYLGTDIDRVIAKKFGVNTATICMYRRMLGIPPKRATYYADLPDKIRKLLGTESDASVARKTGRHWITIHRYRKILGIPPHSMRHPRPPPPPGFRSRSPHNINMEHWIMPSKTRPRRRKSAGRRR